MIFLCLIAAFLVIDLTDRIFVLHGWLHYRTIIDWHYIGRSKMFGMSPWPYILTHHWRMGVSDEKWKKRQERNKRNNIWTR